MISVILGKRVSIWDYQNQINFETEWIKNSDKPEYIVCYKNVRLTHEKCPRNKKYIIFNIFMDIFGPSAKEALKIHRNEFSEKFNGDQYIDEYIKLYIFIYDQAIAGKIDAKGLVDNLEKDAEEVPLNVFLMSTRIYLTEGLVDDIMLFQQKERYYPTETATTGNEIFRWIEMNMTMCDDRYKGIYVTHVPDGIMEFEKSPYLISPITKQVREMVNKNKYLQSKKGYKSDLDAFIELVTGTENFDI